jgi:hypothetical protein
MTEELPFRVIRAHSDGTGEVLARVTKLPIAKGAYEAAVKTYPQDRILLLQATHIVEKSK